VYAMCNPTTRPLGAGHGGAPEEEDVAPGPNLVRMYLLHLNASPLPPPPLPSPPPPSEETVDGGVRSNKVNKVGTGWAIGVTGLVRHPTPSP
jgi:hypothetical protein